MKATYVLDNGVFVKSEGTVIGPLEKEGNLAQYMDLTHDDIYCGEKNWENAEMRMYQQAIRLAMEKGNVTTNDLDAVFGGDLINQNVISHYVLRDFDVPYIGMFGACSTSMETLLTASLLINGGQMKQAIAVTSSHNKATERQYRYPIEYGNKRPDTASFTVTGAGAVLVSKDVSDIRVKSVTIGRVIDAKEKNPYDMGSAMAPAASDTIIRHLNDIGVGPDYYDMIVTGDLSEYGSKVLLDILSDQGYNLQDIHDDCGLMIYSPKQKSTVHAGGSGCACCAVVTYGYLFHLLRTGELNRILVVATGALHNPTMILQKDSMPCIAHAVAFERVNFK